MIRASDFIRPEVPVPAKKYIRLCEGQLLSFRLTRGLARLHPGVPITKQESVWLRHENIAWYEFPTWPGFYCEQCAQAKADAMELVARLWVSRDLDPSDARRRQQESEQYDALMNNCGVTKYVNG